MVVCICPPYIQIKKEEEFSPMGVARGLLIEFVDAAADTADVVIEVFPRQTVHLAAAHPSQHREPP